MGAASLTSRSASASYMSISTHIMSRPARARQIRIAASGFMLKFRSRAMPTSGPTARRKVPRSVSMWRTISGSPSGRSVPGPPPNPGKWTRAGSPG